MITISLTMVVKVVAYAYLCFLSATLLLILTNDKQPSVTRWIVYFLVCAGWLDLLFLHNITSHIRFVA